MTVNMAVMKANPGGACSCRMQRQLFRHWRFFPETEKSELWKRRQAGTLPHAFCSSPSSWVRVGRLSRRRPLNRLPVLTKSFRSSCWVRFHSVRRLESSREWRVSTLSSIPGCPVRDELHLAISSRLSSPNNHTVPTPLRHHGSLRCR